MSNFFISLLKIPIPIRILEKTYDIIKKLGFGIHDPVLVENLEKIKLQKFFFSRTHSADELYYTHVILISLAFSIFVFLILFLISFFLSSSITNIEGKRLPLFLLFLLSLSSPFLTFSFLFKRLMSFPETYLNLIGEKMKDELIFFIQQFMMISSREKPEVGVIYVLKEYNNLFPVTYEYYWDIVDSLLAKGMETRVIEEMEHYAPNENIQYVFKSINDAIKYDKVNETLLNLFNELSFFYTQKVEDVLKEIEGKKNLVFFINVFTALFSSLLPLASVYTPKANPIFMPIIFWLAGVIAVIMILLSSKKYENILK
jgi:hypothetical protein